MANVTVYNVGGSYFLRDPETGQVGTFPKDQVRDLLIKGFQPARQAEYEKQEEEKQYDRPGEAAMGGFVRGATFGLSDLARTAMPSSDLMAAEERKLKEYNPVATTVGEIGGTVAGFAAPGASVGSRITSIGEKVTERLARRAQVAGLEGPLQPASALQKLAGRATAGAIEGGIYGAEQGMADVSLSPKEQRALDIAKTFISHTAGGAALGAGMTSTFSLLGSLGKYTGQKLGVGGGKMLDEYRDATERLSSMQQKVDDRAASLGKQAEELPGLQREIDDIHAKFDILNAQMGEGASARPGVAYSEMIKDRDALQGKVEEILRHRQTIEETKAALKTAKEGAAQAPKATVKPHYKKATLDEYESVIQAMKKNKKGEVPELADIWQETIDRVSLKKDYAKHIKGELNNWSDLVKQTNTFRKYITETNIPKGTPNHQRVVMVLDDMRAKMGMPRLGEQAKNKLLLEGKLLEGQKGIRVGPVLEEVRAGGIADGTASALREDAVGQVNLLKQRLADTQTAMREAQVQLENWGGAKKLTQLNNSIKSLQTVDDGLRARLEELEARGAAARSAKEELGTIGKDPELLKATQEVAALAEQLKAGKAGLLPKIMRRAIEWQTTRTGMQILGANARRMGGGTGVLRSSAALELGRFVAPRLMTALEVGASPIISATRAGIRGTVRSLARPVKYGAVKGMLAEDTPLTEDEFKQVSNELLSTNADLLRVSTSDALRDAPASVADAASNTEANRWQFLIGKLPQDPMQMRTKETGTVVIPVDREWKPSRDALLKFSRYLKTAADPRTFITDLERQQVTPEAVETMQALYPEILSGLRQVVRELVRDAVVKKQVYPASQARQIALFLGESLSSVSPPSMTLRMQANFGHGNERGMPTRGKGTNLKKTVFSEQNLTPLQQVEARK